VIRALFGGSFDPFHEGHLAVIDTLLDRGLCDHVHVVATFISPTKNQPGASADDRLIMACAALADHASVTVEDLEIRRGGTSWTVETLTELSARWPADSWMLVLGADAAAEFHRWRDPVSILEMARPIIFARAGSDVASLLSSSDPIFVPDFKQSVSSTNLRMQLRSGERAGLPLPAPVLAHIIRHDLYRAPNSSSAGG